MGGERGGVAETRGLTQHMRRLQLFFTKDVPTQELINAPSRAEGVAAVLLERMMPLNKEGDNELPNDTPTVIGIHSARSLSLISVPVDGVSEPVSTFLQINLFGV